MYRGKGINENISTEYLLREYDELISCKSLGDYNCCEMISIFLWNKKQKSTSNIYTIFTFEERISVVEKSENLFEKLERITDQYSLGIQRKVLEVSKIRGIFKMLCTSREKQEIDIGDGDLQVGHLEGVTKVFIQQDSTIEILLNKILKNNFRNGSYVLEFFDIDKTVLKIWTPRKLEKLTEKIHSVLPIDLFSVSDRIGNFVFQFPSLNVSSSYSTNETESELTYQVSFCKECQKDDKFMLISEGNTDDSVVAFGTKIFTRDGCEVTFTVGDASRICKTTVIDLKRQLILSRQDTSFMRKISSIMEMGSQYGEQRLIYDENGSLVSILEPVWAEDICVGPPIYRMRDDYIRKRQYDRRVEELYVRAEFRRYGRNVQANQAVADVIALMNRVKIGKVYLWDPYLTVEDLLHTWYFTTSTNVKLYAITSGEIAEKSKVSVHTWISEQQKIMDKRSNHYGIHAELRCQWANYGYSFHDRFLMNVRKDEDRPQVWSLGTSINSLGKKHHIIQSVEHPQMLVDAFEELWEELSDPECLVWKRGM